MISMVSEIFNVMTEALEGFFGVLSGGITNVVNLFYTKPVGEAPGGFTFLGTILLIGLGIGLVWTLIKWISGLVRNVAR